MYQNNSLPNNIEKKITIGLVIGQLSVGGAEKQIYELAVELLADNLYKPIVICHSNYLNPYGPLLEKAGILVVAPDSKISYISKMLWLRNKIEQFGIKIVYAFLTPTNIYCWAVTRGTGLVFIASVRGLPKLNPILKIGYKASLMGSDIIIANSESGKCWAEKKFKIIPQKIKVIPNSVKQLTHNPTANENIRKFLNIERDSIIIGLTSILKETKCPDLFLEVATGLLRINHNVHFIWVGDGPLYKDMLFKHEKLSANFQSKIHFVGEKNNIEEWLSSFDIFIQMSHSEGLSNSIMEAMSIGLPCVCSEVPGIVDIIINNESGLLVRNEKEAWINSLDYLINNPEKMLHLGQNAQKKMMDYSPSLLSTKTSVIITQLLTKKYYHDKRNKV